MRKALFLLILFLTAVSVYGSVTALPDKRCSAEDFFIAPCDHGHAKWTVTDTEEYMKDLYEAGFNVSPFLDLQDIKYAVNNKLSVRMFAFEFTDENIKDLDAQAKDWALKLRKAVPEEYYSSICQVYLQDEPIKKDMAKLKAYSKACREYAGLRPYINLLPNDVSHNHLGYKDYKEYADVFTKECGMDFLSYDNYSFYLGEGFRQNKFYSNLEEAREVALKNNVPFHNIILCAAHFNYEEPTDYSISVQGWSTLAYGGRGLVYFSVVQPPIGNYRMAPYDGYGNRTSVWYNIQSMNFAVHNIMPYYKDLNSVNVYHIGNIPKGSKGPESSVLVESIDFSTFDNNNDLLVGEFVGKDKKEYAIIVNKNPKYGAYINSIKFKKGNSKIMHISEYSHPFRWNSENDQVAELTGEDLWIKSGHGILVRAD